MSHKLLLLVKNTSMPVQEQVEESVVLDLGGESNQLVTDSVEDDQRLGHQILN
jgi:hypothetical protein